VAEQRKKSVHIADRDEAVRESLRAFLETCGYSVQTYASSEDYLRRADTESADCLLLDLRVSGRGGIELLEQLRTRGVSTPAIILSTNGSRMNARMQRAGVLKVLVKPVTGEDLLHWIEKACG